MNKVYYSITAVLILILSSCSTSPKRDYSKTCTKEDLLTHQPHQDSMFNDLKEKYQSDTDKLSMYDVSLTFDCNKGRIYSLYSRQLRKVAEQGKDDSDLRGKIVFELTILPSGIVKKVDVIESKIKDEKFIRKLSILIKHLQFPEKVDGPTTIQYPIDFIPS